MKANVTVGRNVRRLRVANGLSQVELAVDVGITPNYLSKLEGEVGNPTLDVLERLAAALSVEIGALLKPVPSRVAPLPSGRGRKR